MRLNRSDWVTQGFVVCCLMTSGSVQAQIAPDGTLGNERSRVTPINPNTERIDGGAIRGSNLFHSFQEFSIGEGRGAYFANPTGVDNILSRVTGRNPSNILGTLGVLGNANLYLLNPNGIFFGPNARLDIRGSFTASTADSVVFSDRALYSATDTQTRPLLTVAVPIGLQYGAQQAGTISNAGNLAVGQGQKLTLLGGTVTSTGQLNAPGGTVQVLGNQVALLDNARIDVSSATGGGTVLVGGDFQGKGEVPNAAQTFVAPGVTINADALTNGNGGRVIIWADDTTRFYGNISARGGANSGNGGFVEVSGKQNLAFWGNVNLSAPKGNLGTLLLDPDNINIVGGAGAPQDASLPNVPVGAAPATFTISQAALQSQPGTVTLQAANDITIAPGVSLNFVPGGAITFTADADQDGIGSFRMDTGQTIRAAGRNIEISGASLSLGNISTNANLINGGNIQLTATNGNIRTGNLVSSSNSPTVGNAARGGSIKLDATNGSITVIGDNTVVPGTNTVILSNSIVSPNVLGNAQTGGDIIFNAVNGIDISGGIVSQSFNFGTGDSGKAGDIKFTTTNGDIVVSGDMLANSNLGIGNSGNGGAVTFNAINGNIAIRNLTTESFIFRAGNSANGGEITLTAGGTIKTENLASLSGGNSAGNAGTITLFANRGITTNSINAGSSGTGSGGDITLISRNGVIDTRAGVLYSTSVSGIGVPIGKGGNITISADSGSILAGSIESVGLLGGEITLTSSNLLSLNQSDIASISTGSNRGGNVSLTAPSISSANARVATITTGSGQAGDLVVNATNSISITDTFLGSLTLGSGKGGNVDVNTGQVGIMNTPVKITGGGLFEQFVRNLPDGSGLYTTTGGSGNSGGITVNTKQLTIQNNEPGLQGLAGITTATQPRSNGSAGVIAINASDFVEIIGNQPNAFKPAPSSRDIAFQVQKLPTGITSATEGFGNAGQIIINTNQLKIQDGAAITSGVSSVGKGNGNDITINASSVELLRGAAIATATLPEVPLPLNTGNAGNLTINASQQVNLDGGLIAVDTLGPGKTGNLEINAGELNLSNFSRIGAATYTTGQGGSIILKVAGNINLRNNSEITSEAFNTANGGGINIRADGVIFSPSLADNNDIVATAQQGQGGQVVARAAGIFSFRAYNGVRTPESDFTAVALSGQNGNVTPQTQNPQPPPPIQPIVREIPQVCPQGVTSRQAGKSQYVNTGRGGLPPNPGDALESNVAQVPWVTLEPEEQKTSSATTSRSSDSATPEVVEEAEGWVRLPNGKVRLTNQTSTFSSSPCVLRSSQQ